MTDLIQSLYQSEANQQHKLGELYSDPWGNRFRYVQAGAVALAQGQLMQEAAEDTNFRSMAVAVAAAYGSTQVSVTLGATAVTSGMFESGYFYIESAAGLGQQFRIVRHEIADAAAACIFTLDRPVQVALTTSSQVSVRKNPFDGVIVFPTTPTGGPVGIATTAIGVGEYGWVQSGGDVAALFDTGVNTAADVTGIMPSADVAGSVSPAAETDVSPPYIGFAREQVSVDSTYGMVHLTID